MQLHSNDPHSVRAANAIKELLMLPRADTILSIYGDAHLHLEDLLDDLSRNSWQSLGD